MISDNLRLDITMPKAASHLAGDQPTDQIFSVLPNLNSETLLANASQTWHQYKHLQAIWLLTSTAHSVMRCWGFIGCWKVFS